MNFDKRFMPRIENITMTSGIERHWHWIRSAATCALIRQPAIKRKCLKQQMLDGNFSEQHDNTCAKIHFDSGNKNQNKLQSQPKLARI